MFEFEPTYILDTGSLTDYYTGSGIHLYKDTSLTFDILEPGGNVFLSDIEVFNSPLIKNIQFDILSISGNLLYENFKTGKNRFITITEKENISLFGFYQKDFGIRATVSSTMNDELFLAEFYLYGNIPSINHITAYDGSPDFISGGSGVYDKIQLYMYYNNNLNYIKYNRVDVYAHTSPLNDFGIQSHGDISFKTISSNPYYIYSHASFNNSMKYQQDYLVEIPANNLSYSVPYYLAVVPYSELGSGEAKYIGPFILTSENSGNFGEGVFTTNQIELLHGNSSMNIDFITGIITGSIDTNTVLDSIPKSLYSTITYTSQIKDSNSAISSSELKFAITSTGSFSGVSFSEYAISDNNYPVYSYTNSNDYIYLNVSGVSPTGIFKLYKIAL
jgi:hypothetical protein